MIKNKIANFLFLNSFDKMDRQRNTKITRVADSFGSQDQYEPHETWAQTMPVISPKTVKNQAEYWIILVYFSHFLLLTFFGFFTIKMSAKMIKK